jgi:mandelamide amidase
MLANYFSNHGLSAMIFPATMVPATPIGQATRVLIGGAQVPFATAIARNITPGSTAGLPGLVLPAGLTSDTRLPVGLELDGPAGSDRTLLGIGLALEAALDPVSAPVMIRSRL